MRIIYLVFYFYLKIFIPKNKVPLKKDKKLFLFLIFEVLENKDYPPDEMLEGLKINLYNYKQE